MGALSNFDRRFDIELPPGIRGPVSVHALEIVIRIFHTSVIGMGFGASPILFPLGGAVLEGSADG